MKIFKYKSWKEYKSHLLTKWFTEWVNDEYDVETLSMTRTMVQKRENQIKSIIDISNKVEVKGFRNDER